MTRCPLSLAVFSLLIAVVTTAGAPRIIAPYPTLILAASTPAPQNEKIDVGGYKLQILCKGQGTPTVVVDAGLGEPAVESGTWGG